MSKYNAQAIYAAFAKPTTTVSKEENDLNININAEHEGDKGGDEPADVVAPVGADEVATVETEETPVVEEEVEVAPVVEDTSGTPEAAELDVDDASDEAEETEEQIEDISEAAEGLEGIALTLAKISVEGLEVSPLTAQMLNDHYDFVVRKFPALKAEPHRIASMEAWGVSQEDAGTVSLEKVMDNLKAAGSAAVKFLKELLQQFLAFLGSVVSASTIMKRKATELQAQSKKVQYTAKQIAVPALLTTADFNAASIKDLANLLDSLGTKPYEWFARTDILKEGVDLDEISKDQLNLGALLASVKPFIGKTFIGGFKIENTNGGPVITGVEGKDGQTTNMSSSEAGSVATAVIGLAIAIEAYKKGEAIRAKAVGALSAISEKLNSMDEDRKASKAKALRGYISQITKMLAFERRLVNKAVAVGNAANNVVASSLKGATSERGVTVAK